MKQLDSDLHTDERELIHHLGHMARALEEAPPEIIAWNRAIDAEIATRNANPKSTKKRRAA